MIAFYLFLPTQYNFSAIFLSNLILQVSIIVLQINNILKLIVGLQKLDKDKKICKSRQILSILYLQLLFQCFQTDFQIYGFFTGTKNDFPLKIIVQIKLMDFPAENKFEPEPHQPNQQVEQTIKESKKLSKKREIAEYIKVIGDIDENQRTNYKMKVLEGDKRIQWDPQFSDQIKFETTQLNTQSLEVMVHYGNYKMKISILMGCFDDQSIKNQVIGEGSFGCIYRAYSHETEYVLKGIKIFIDQGKINLNHIFKEYFISSIASSLEVGPKIGSIMGYDIVAFGKRAFFAMQKCRQLRYENSNTLQMYNQLTDSLRLIHSIGLIHLDIKPDNIAYSFIQQKYVFLDFGLSRIVKQTLGQKTLTTFAGTQSYCSVEMRKIYWLGKEAFIDLYYNDLISLKKTYKVLIENSQQKSSLSYQNQQYFQCSFKEQQSYLRSITKVCLTKYYIFTKDITNVEQIVRANFELSKTFYIILEDEFLSADLRNSALIKTLISDLKDYLVEKRLNASIYDEQISKLLSQKQRPVLTPSILTIEYILQLPKEKFQTALDDLDFVHKLFIVFDPQSQAFSQHKSGMVLNYVNNLRTKIIEKVSECLPNCKKENMLFYEQVRETVIFFYDRLKILKKTNILASIRLIFLMMEDYTLISRIEHQICELASDISDKILKALQFTLFYFQINHIQQEQHKIEVFIKYLGGEKNYQIANHKQPKLLQSSYMILSIYSNFLCSKYSKGQIVTCLKQWKKQFHNYNMEQLNTIQMIVYSSMNMSIKNMLQSQQITLFQYFYSQQFSPTLKEHNSVCSFFKFQLRISSSVDQTHSVEQFKYEIQKLFSILKIIKMYQPKFLSRKESIIFYYDFQLALAAIQAYAEHIILVQPLNGQQAFNSLQVFEWIIYIFHGNLKVRKSQNQYNYKDTIAMINLIQQSFSKFLSKTSLFKQQLWYFITTKSLQCLILLFKDQSNLLEPKIKQLRVAVSSPYSNTNVIKIFINLIYCILQKCWQAQSLISSTLSDLCQNVILQVRQAYSDNLLLELFQKTALLQMLVKIYSKNRSSQKGFDLIQFTIYRLNECSEQIKTQKTQIFYPLKIGMQTFCRCTDFFLRIVLLNQLRARTIDSLYPQDVYFEYCLLSSIAEHLNITAYALLQQSLTGNLLLLGKHIIRIGNCINRRKLHFEREVQLGLYRCYRLNGFEYKSCRKRLACLRKEGLHKMLQKIVQKKLEKVREIIRAKAEEKLLLISSNYQLVIPKIHFKLQRSQIADPTI